MTLFPSPRALVVRSAAIPELAGVPALVPLKLQGREGVNSLFEYQLVLQTPDACSFMAGEGSDLDLEGFIGRELTCGIELEGHGSFTPGVPGGPGANQGAGEREISGLITRARFIGESSRHALYELTLRPWLHLASLTTDCRVFQDLSPVEVIEDVLARYAFATDRRLIETYPRRDYTVQYNESDFEFVTRLMQEWGINYHFEHAGGVHRLVWSDHNGAFQPTRSEQQSAGTSTSTGASAYHRIPFHPLGHKIDQEYIHGFSPIDSLTSGSYASRDHDYTRPRATLDAQAAAPRETGHARQAVYLWRGDRAGLGGSDYSQPNMGADKAAHQTEAQGEHLARLRMQVLRQSGRRATGVGHLRGIVPGCTFTLTGHPRAQANAEYIALETRFVIENVGQDAQRAVQPGATATTAFTGVALSDAQRLSGQWRVAVDFDVQPTTEALRPELTQRKPKTGGPETARVVGPDAATAETNIHTDALGRIKVQFPWDRYGQHDQRSSCWVRVGSAWAGNQLGAMHVPRVGQEVVVDFLGGDPDLPIVTARVYNQLNPPPWRLPEQQALSGFRSRELTSGGGNSAGGRSNHLILDDTAEKIQAQLKSDHQSSSLSLGHITRIEDNAGRQEARGEGFELRTDGHGAIRAKDGLLITTEGRARASAHAKDMAETVQRLARGRDQHERLGALAQQHRAQEASDQGEVTQGLKAQNAAIEGQTGQKGGFPELGEPHLVLASPAGIQSTTAGSTHQHSAQHHAITAGGHASVSTARSWLVSATDAIRMFAYRAGMKLIAAGGDIDIQALKQSVNVVARLEITHTADRITLNAKEEIMVNGGGSYTAWKSGGIEEGTTGAWRSHAATHGRTGPANLPLKSMTLPTASLKPESGTLVFDVLTQPEGADGTALAGEPYELLKDGNVIDRGLTNDRGQVVVKNHQPGTKAYQVRLSHGAMHELRVSEAPNANAEHRLGNQGYRTNVHHRDRATGNGLDPA